MHTHVVSKGAFVFASLVLAAVVSTGCSSSDPGSTGSSGGSTSPANPAPSGTSGNANPSGCTGEITTCPVGSLSTDQLEDMCGLLLAAIDAPAGTKFECTSGPNQGNFVTVKSKTECAAQRAPASCKITVGQTLDCFKAAKKDACTAWDSDGACAQLLSPSSGCTQ